MKVNKNKILVATACGVVVTSIGVSMIISNSSKDKESNLKGELEENYLEENDVNSNEEVEEEIVDETEGLQVEDDVNDEEDSDISSSTYASASESNSSSSSINESNSTNNEQNNSQSSVQTPVVEEEVKNDVVIEEPSIGNEESNTSKYSDGTYDGSASGFAGTMQVRVQISNGKISNISVVSHSETPGFYERVIESIPASIISAQETNVDTISGATYTSNGIINAVNNALSKA